MNNVTTVGIDLAKNVFSLHGVDAGAGRSRGARYGARSWGVVAQLAGVPDWPGSVLGRPRVGAAVRRSVTPYG